MKRILRTIGIVVVGILVVAVGAYAALALTLTPMPAHPFFRADDPAVLVIAHQGGDGERPGNTMAAFRNAAAVGADVLEMDVHSSSDGVLVVIHDDTVDRTTDGSGRVNDLTFAELSALDAGYDWVPNGAEDTGERAFRGQGVTIPALEEVITAFPDYRMVIEIKQESPSIVEPLCAMLRDYGAAEQVIVASFRPTPLYAFRAACPEVATSGTEEEIRPFFFLNLVGLGRAWRAPFHAFQVPEYGAGFHVVTEAFVEGARLHNVAVQPWTINQREDMERMIAIGVDGMITDYPSLLLELTGR